MLSLSRLGARDVYTAALLRYPAIRFEKEQRGDHVLSIKYLYIQFQLLFCEVHFTKGGQGVF
jgi:hypothetical protein